MGAYIIAQGFHKSLHTPRNPSTLSKAIHDNHLYELLFA